VTRNRPLIPRHLSDLYARDLRSPELWSGTTAIAWAVAFFAGGQILPPATFDLMERLASGNKWALFCLIGGIAQVLSVVLYSRYARWICAVVMGWFPLTVSISIAYSPYLVHIAVYGGWFFMNLYSILRLPRRAR